MMREKNRMKAQSKSHDYTMIELIVVLAVLATGGLVLLPLGIWVIYRSFKSKDDDS